MERDVVVNERDQTEIDGLLEHWKSTLELRNDQITTFDKSILWASGGSLALTLANIDKLTGTSGVTVLFILSWLAFALSVCANIVSYWTSYLDADLELKKIRRSVEEGASYKFGNVLRRATYALNFLALLLFLIGICMLASHCYINLRTK